MKKTAINLKELKATMPKNGTVSPKKKNGRWVIECKIQWPSLSEQFPMDFGKRYDEILEKQRKVVGAANISEFYTETTGQWWFIYLKLGNVYEFVTNTETRKKAPRKK